MFLSTCHVQTMSGGMFPLPVTGLFGKLNITLCACMHTRVNVRARVCVCMLTWCFMYCVNYCRKPKRASDTSEVDAEVRAYCRSALGSN